MQPKLPNLNTLFYGDNLDILREYIPSESVDLVYLDPPFNSNRNYNVLFKDEHGKEAEAQITAFEDTWHWGHEAEETYHYIVTTANDRVASMIGALRSFIGPSQMLAYLVMMAARLVELHRVLKPTGSLYLHCDPTASHYLKVILDATFSPRCFRSEIVWKRSSAHSDTRQGAKQPGRIHDTLLFYSKDALTWTWNPVYTPYDEEYVKTFYRGVEETTGRRFALDNLTAAKPGGDTSYEWKGVKPYNGRYWAYSKAKMEAFDLEGRLYYTRTGMPRFKRYLDEMPGVSLQDVWTDIPPALGSQDLGYPTQKPLALLERILQISSNSGDIVLDPFCGCGTAVAAAEKLGRRWMGIDITHLAIALQKSRLKEMFADVHFQTIGEPEDIGAARQLAQEDRYQFQYWALSLIEARPLGGQVGSKSGKKGSDRGIDGIINFIDDNTSKPKRVLSQVKSGHVRPTDVRDLRGTLEREGAALGVFITLEPPTREMQTEAAAAGFYQSPGWGRTFPKLQILTIADLLSGKHVQMPPPWGTFRQAQRIDIEGEQPGLGI